MVNLNARVYYPAIGRFMTPVPDLFNPQALNRLTYVENGPLSYTDPTVNAPFEVGQPKPPVFTEQNKKKLAAEIRKYLAEVQAERKFENDNPGGSFYNLDNDTKFAIAQVAIAVISALASAEDADEGEAAQTADQRAVMHFEEELQHLEAAETVAASSARAAARQAMREEGVPTSRSRSDVKASGGQPVQQSRRQQLTSDSSGRPVVISNHEPHPNGTQLHDAMPHVHVAPAKVDPDTGQVLTRPDGSVYYRNGGSVAPYIGD